MICVDSHFQWPWMGKWTLLCIPSGEAAGEESGRRAELPTSTYTHVRKYPLQKLMWREEDSRLQMLGPLCFQNPPFPLGQEGSKVVLPGIPCYGPQDHSEMTMGIFHSNTLSSVSFLCSSQISAPSICPVPASKPQSCNSFRES